MLSDVVNNPQLGRLASRAPVLLIVAAVLLFAAAQVSINAVNGWWIDEYYALWASDTSVPFIRGFSERIYPDTNPPLYFSALYLARLVFEDDRSAILALNVSFILAAAMAVLLVSRRAGVLGLAAVAITAFVLSGPVLVYASEGRAYLAALVVAFVTSWCVALAVEEPNSRPGVPVFAVLGALGALTHVYAALFCGTMAAGLLVLALWDRRRRDLVIPALALGLSATVVLAVWIVSIAGSLNRVGWMEFTRSTVAAAVWYVKEITVGPRILGLLLIALLSLALIRERTRPLVVVFGIAFGLFIVLPLIMSLKIPMITGRYWMVGAPGLIVLLSFVARCWWQETSERGFVGWPPFALVGVVALACATSVSGFVTAREFVSSKPVWKGAEIVGRLVDGCPVGSVHVGSGKIEDGGYFDGGFALAARAPAGIFVDVGSASTGELPISDARCPVVGWAEHVLLGNDFLRRAPDEELIRLLRIQGTPRDVEVRRHATGFVLLKRR